MKVRVIENLMLHVSFIEFTVNLSSGSLYMAGRHEAKRKTSEQKKTIPRQQHLLSDSGLEIECRPHLRKSDNDEKVMTRLILQFNPTRTCDATHHAVKRVNLSDQNTLSDSTNGRVARELANLIDLLRQKQSPSPRSCCTRRGLAACVATSNDAD